MKRNTLPEFANLVGISATRAGQLRRNGVLAGDSLPELVRSYCTHLREQAAGRASGGSLDLAQERAALAAAQRQRIEREEQVARGELIPADLAVRHGVALAQTMVGALGAWPGRLSAVLHAAESQAEVGALLGEAVHDIRLDLEAAVARAHADFRRAES